MGGDSNGESATGNAVLSNPTIDIRGHPRIASPPKPNPGATTPMPVCLSAC